MDDIRAITPTKFIAVPHLFERRPLSRKKNIGKSKKLINLRKQIIKFCLGKKKKIDADFELSGSNLQKKIWNELYKIPYGSIETYGEIAKKVNTSPRYVGNVCGQNKHLLVIPCHRVIRSNGSIGGFSAIGGIVLKIMRTV